MGEVWLSGYEGSNSFLTSTKSHVDFTYFICIGNSIKQMDSKLLNELDAFNQPVQLLNYYIRINKICVILKNIVIETQKMCIEC